MNFNMISFGYQGHDVRTTQDEGQTWWFLFDICDVLGFKDYQTVVRYLELIGVEVALIDTPGDENAFIIREEEVIDLLASIPMPKAKSFKRWMIGTAIPSLDIYRARTKPQRSNLADDTKTLTKAIAAHKARRARLAQLEADTFKEAS